MSNWWERCTRVEKPDVGLVHFHRRVWSPWRVSSMWFQPSGRSVVYPVPDGVWEELLSADSFEGAMAVVRVHGKVSDGD